MKKKETEFLIFLSFVYFYRKNNQGIHQQQEKIQQQREEIQQQQEEIQQQEPKKKN